MAADAEDEVGAGVITAAAEDDVTAEEDATEEGSGFAGVAEGGIEVAGMVGPGAGAAKSEPAQRTYEARMSQRTA